MPNAAVKTQGQSTKKPTHIAYYTRKGRDGEKDFWVACGAAWTHQDGRGLRIKLDAVPTGGVIELRANGPQANSVIEAIWHAAPESEG